MLDFELYGLAGSALVALLLEGLKALTRDEQGSSPIRDRWAVLASVVIGLGLAVVAGLIAGDATFAAWSERIMQGLLAGFAACGVFSVTKRREAVTMSP